MTTPYEKLQKTLVEEPCTWLVTGAAGFIGSHLVETLLGLGQRVRGLDNFATGHPHNLEGAGGWAARGGGEFTLIEGDITGLEICRDACQGADYVLNQAGLGSVPRSIADPLASHASNVTGTLNILVAARDAEIRRVVYASSSSVYGDEQTLPKTEERTGNLLSPYAATKWIDEIYADVFARTYGMEVIGLRYFNVFGPRQDPDGAYAAVIPKWVAAMLAGTPVTINGDGETSRDFCYVANVVQANLLAATSPHPDAANQAYNVAVGERSTLNQLFFEIGDILGRIDSSLTVADPLYQDFREGDVRHSLADISKACERLGYRSSHCLSEGLEIAVDWYHKNL